MRQYGPAGRKCLRCPLQMPPSRRRRPTLHRRRSLGFLNWAHFLDHYVILIFPTVVLGLEAVYRRGYGDLLMLSTAAFTAFGLFALPCGWLADHWSRRNMMAIYFFGTGLSCIAVGLTQDFHTLAIALFARRPVCGDLPSGRHSDGDRCRRQPRPHHGVERRVRKHRRVGCRRRHRLDHGDDRLALGVLRTRRAVLSFRGSPT